jgi:hypothetical protein
VTTFVQFAPNPVTGFSFQAVLDGNAYEMRVFWNIFGQRWYITAVASDGSIVFTLPVIGSPNSGTVNLTAGYFVASLLAYRTDTGNFEIWP